MPPEGFSFFHQPRIRRRGEGIGLFVSSAHKFTAISLPTQTSFEAISGKLECCQSCLVILNIYRPPGPATAFFSELQDILSYISTLPHDLALMGDFNLRIDFSSPDSGRLSGILDSFDLHEYVDFSTHIHGYSLDLMICSPGCNVLSVSASDLISDSIIWQCPPHSHQSSCPIGYQKISIKPPKPWMTPAILASKRYRRYLERVWRRNPTALNRSRLTRQTHLWNRQMSKAKSA